MRKGIFLLSLILCFCFQLLAQEKPTITVRASEVSNGVVIVTGVNMIDSGKRTSVELQCNVGHARCAELKAGTYTMVRLPKNHGVYECENVDLYAGDADSTTAQRIGEYCLTEK